MAAEHLEANPARFGCAPAAIEYAFALGVLIRRLTATAGAWLLLVSACTSGSGPSGLANSDDPQGDERSPGATVDGMAGVACSLPKRWLVRIRRGYDPARNGEIQFLPKRPNFVGGGLPHAGPWDFLSEVPMLWYGPGHIPPVGKIDRQVTAADIAPTLGKLVGYNFDAADGEPIEEILGATGGRPPRLILTVIWDAAGRKVLAEWPDAWRNLRGLIAKGAWLENATIGSSPASSAQIHATIGTGAFPRNHGVTGHHIRQGKRITAAWRSGPGILSEPTLADVYDKARGNEPLAGMLGTVAIQLGMLGHGAAWDGGDRDLAVVREPADAEGVGEEGVIWNLPPHLADLYELPRYANRLPPLSAYFPIADRIDGNEDGTWRGHDFRGGNVRGGLNTPARIPYQTRLLEEVIKREGFGRDDVPDLLYLNFKLIDEIGHEFTLNSHEMEDSIRIHDDYLPGLIDFLDKRVGKGEWVLLITSDHGSTPDPNITGAFRISAGAIHSGIQRTFDLDDDDVRVAEMVKQTEVFINTDELAEQGFTLEDVAEYLMSLTQKETVIEGYEATSPNQRVIQAAFPSRIMEDLPCLRGDQGGG